MHPETQSHYQVRFDRGARGAAAIALGADVVVWADALGDPAAPSAPDGVLLHIATAADADAVAGRILARQTELGRRCMIAIIAAGDAYGDGAFRAAVEDDLVAGAVVDALMSVGIDFCSPEAALVGAGYTALRGAVGHLTSASVTARLLAD